MRKNAHLLRCPSPASLRRTLMYALLLVTSGALHLDIFPQPAVLARDNGWLFEDPLEDVFNVFEMVVKIEDFFDLLSAQMGSDLLIL